ncbi:fimbrial protein [Escherichia coli]|uniref:fimbrial protein n=1 Tax=Escherichia coli TaxID=562 RepID=UPI0039F6CFA1
MKYNNIIFLGLCLGLTTYSALSADSVIKISGRVLDYGCTVSSDSLNFTVDLQKNSARQFPTTGSTSPVVPFQITLSECSKGTTGVRVAFNGIEDAENNTLLKLDEGSNTASGLGIEILDANMRPVFANTAPDATKASGVGVSLMRNGKILATGENVSLGTVNKSKVPLGLSATYGQTGNKVAAGTVQSVIGVTFIYE